MLNLPIGYDVKDPRMMDSIPETEQSPPSNRRESVTVRPNDADDVTYVSVYPNTERAVGQPCTLRKRLVDNSVQTDDVISTKNSHAEQKIKKNPLSFITSISIKSGISKSSDKRTGFTNPSYQSKSFDNMPENDSTCVSNRKNTGNKVLRYNPDDIPRNRSASANNLETTPRFDIRESPSTPPRAQTPPTDYDQAVPFSSERDASFNDCSSINDDSKYQRLDDPLYEVYENAPYVRSPFKYGAVTHNAGFQFGESGNDVTDIDDVNKRVTPVEGYIQPIQFVPKSKQLTRKYSTHV